LALFVVGSLTVVDGVRPWAPVILLLVALLPALALRRARHVRTARIEASINAFAIAFSNALKTSPSIGKALARVQDVVSGPLSDELTLTLRELRLGTTVDQALLNLSTRVQSDRLDVLLGGVLIGRQVGGPIPTILETTAATFRELDRLHGVLRAKTSEGKGQVLIMALSPALIIFAFDALQPGYFEPLFSHVAGLAIVAVCSLSWLGSVLLARKILAVEI
jgi:tight adherence protein B